MSFIGKLKKMFFGENPEKAEVSVSSEKVSAVENAEKSEVENTIDKTGKKLVIHRGINEIKEKEFRRVAEMRKKYAYLVPYYNRYNEKNPGRSFTEYAESARYATPVDYETPTDDPCFDSGWYDRNKHESEFRLAKNGEYYYAIF